MCILCALNYSEFRSFLTNFTLAICKYVNVMAKRNMDNPISITGLHVSCDKRHLKFVLDDCVEFKDDGKLVELTKRFSELEQQCLDLTKEVCKMSVSLVNNRDSVNLIITFDIL